MTKINIITPPDILHNQNDTFLLIYPSEELRSDFQTFLEKCDKPLNVYLYAPEVEEEKDLLLDSINDNKESERTREEQQHGKVVKKMKVSFASVVRQGSK